MSGVGVELDHLRVPFEKIKFGREIEFRGYGSVFEGTVDDQPVALKRINITNLSDIKTRILGEIRQISGFRHPNLVALLGFCDEKSNEIILVYEYVSGGSLADSMSKHLNTIQRLEICLGAARGLDCLHTGVVGPTSTTSIVHGDVKPSKILLQGDATESKPSKFEAKISNFGLSKVRPGQVVQSVDPTPAYRDPEFEVTGKVTKESDVYSLGVVLLEVLCGVPELVDTDDYQERPVTELVPKRLEQNKLRKIVHFDIRNEFKTEALETYAKIACQCVEKDPKDRPPMSRVVEQLEEALRLQGGEVPFVPRFGSANGDNIVHVNGEKKEDENGVIMEVDEPKKELEEVTVGGEGNTDDLKSDENVDVDEEIKEDNGSKNSSTALDSNIGGDQEEDAEVVMLEINDPESEMEVVTTSKEEKTNGIQLEDDQKENAEDVVANLDDSDNKEEKTNGIQLEDVQKENVEVVVTNLDDSDNKEEKTNGIHIEDTQKENAEVVVSNLDDSDNKEEKTNGIHLEDPQKENAEVVVANVDDSDNEEAKETNDLGSGDTVNFGGENKSDITFPELSEDQQKNIAECVSLEQGSYDVTETETMNADNVAHENQFGDPGEEKNAISATMNSYTTEKKPEAIIVSREGNFNDFASNDKLMRTETKRSSSESSESSNGDGTNPSDRLLQRKSTANDVSMKKRVNNSGSCCSCFASWRHLFSNSVHLLQNCFVRRAILE